MACFGEVAASLSQGAGQFYILNYYMQFFEKVLAESAPAKPSCTHCAKGSDIIFVHSTICSLSVALVVCRSLGLKGP